MGDTEVGRARWPLLLPIKSKAQNVIFFYLFMLGLLWFFVTVIGHATWVFFAKLFNSHTVTHHPRKPDNQRHNRFTVAKSIINQLHNEGRIDSDTNIAVLSAVIASENADTASLESDQRKTPTGHQPLSQPTLDSSNAAATVDPAIIPQNQSADKNIFLATLVIDNAAETTLSQPGLSPQPTPDRLPLKPASTSGTTDLKQTDVSQSQAESLREHSQDTKLPAKASKPKQPPTLSTSEIIQSFLSAHNIRWGELIAGMLIVVCSIGLVISLWGPLVKTHRAIPTLIFLAANAAIYSVGLYTLSRWRLRHTSRAVLVIATLLIPLSVLAGIAGSGIDASQTIELSDPITLVTIGLAGLIYSLFLYLGGKALSSRSHVWSIVAAVAGPVLTLVMTPAVIRSFGWQAGWFLAFGTTFVIAACAILGGLSRRKSTSLGPAVARLYLLVMGFSAYSLAIAAVSMGYNLRDFGMQAFLPMAMASIPACVALAGIARSLMDRARNSTASMIGAVCCILLLAITLVVIIPAMSSYAWLWTWALVMSISLIAGRFLFQQPSWYAISTLPAGLVAVCTAQVWLGRQVWETSALWTKLVSGEALIACLLMTAATGVLLWPLSKGPAKSWMKYVNLVWVGMTLLLAVVLSLAPDRFMGVIPSWVVEVTLCISAITTFIYSLRDYRVCYATALASFFGYYSLFKSLPSVSLEIPSGWIYLTMCVAATVLTFSELSCRLAPRLKKAFTLNALAVQNNLAVIGIGVVVIATFTACIGLTGHFRISVTAFSIATILLVWASTIMGRLEVFKAAQITSVLLAAAIAHHYFDTHFTTNRAWLSGGAFWAWSLAFGTVAGFWYLIREAVLLYLKRFQGEEPVLAEESTTNIETPCKSRIGRLFGQPIPPLAMPDTWFILAAAALSACGTIYFFACLTLPVWARVQTPYEPSWGLPLCSWLVVATLAGLLKRHDFKHAVTSWLMGLSGLTVILWVSCQAATTLLADVKLALILAVSLSTVLIFAATSILAKKGSSILSKQMVMAGYATQCCILFLGSVSLLWPGFFQPLANGKLTDLHSTLSISTWWFIVSFLSLRHARKAAQEWSLLLSVLFFAAAGTMLVPAFTFQTIMASIQTAALLTFAWLCLATRFFHRQDDVEPNQVITEFIHAVFKLGVVAGMITSVLVTIRILLDLDFLDPLVGPVGFTLSLTSAVAIAWKPVQVILTGVENVGWNISVRLVVSVLAGQVAWLLHSLGLLDSSLASSKSAEVIAGIWVMTCVASVLMYRSRQSVFGFFHTAGVTIATAMVSAMVDVQSTFMPWIGLIAAITAGAQISLVAISKKNEQIPDIAVRVLGWVVGAWGGFLIWRLTDLSDFASASVTMLWLTLWIVVWRYISRDQPNSEQASRNTWCLPDMEFSAILCVAAFADVANAVTSDSIANPMTNPLLWLRGTCYVISAVSVLCRPRHTAEWFFSLATAGFAFSLLIVSTADAFLASTSQQFTAMLISYALFFVLVTACLSNIARMAGKMTSIPTGQHFQKLTSTLTAILTFIAFVGICSPIIMIASRIPLAEIQVAIGTVALAAWAIAELADQASIAKLRYVAVSLGLVSIALWASVGSQDMIQLLLAACMRWLVASVLLIPFLTAVLPKLLGERLGSLWMDAFRMGAKITVFAAIGSAFAMLALEFNLRDSNGIADISLVIVIGAALTLGLLSLLSGGVAIATGPQGKLQKNLRLTDQQRSYLIIGTQLVGFMTWLHLFLCKPEWAFLGLRGIWPYVVMGLAFVSVGITEFAERRGDLVMSNTIKKTALYLPLIPVVGLWLSASNQSSSFFARMLDSHYAMLLVVAAVYYMAIGMRWKSTLTRVSGIVLGNLAWWFVLAQWPGWSFLLHPQLWLIPPAACVLLVTHIYRDRLDAKLASGIRYGSTLVIYISSSADMLLQQIGTTLAGPVILILLALTGMLLGVVLRIRPFLYLGASFVFLGVTSMVWHAHRAFDSIWPWWVFGISMGLLLLAGLMLLERFKPQLRMYAQRLSTWDS